MDELDNFGMNIDVIDVNLSNEEMNKEIEVSFVKTNDLVKDDPFAYDWTILESGGDISKIEYSKNDLFVELSLDKDNKHILEWMDRLKKIGKPYIFAKGTVTEKYLNMKMDEKYKSIKKIKNKNKIIKKVFTLQNGIAYGLFSISDY